MVVTGVMRQDSRLAGDRRRDRAPSQLQEDELCDQKILKLHMDCIFILKRLSIEVSISDQYMHFDKHGTVTMGLYQNSKARLGNLI